MLKRHHSSLGANATVRLLAAGRRQSQFSVEAVQWKSLWKLFFCALEQSLGIPLLLKQCRERCSGHPLSGVCANVIFAVRGTDPKRSQFPTRAAEQTKELSLA